LSFASYAESLPEAGDESCISGAYARKHNPVANWQGSRLPADVNKRFADFPQDFSRLPAVSFVIPDQNNDMHNGSFADADDWLKLHIAPYVDWAMKHNSLLILTWDEDHYQSNNRIATILVGPMVKAGKSDQRINHYNVLRTLLDFYGLPALAQVLMRRLSKGSGWETDCLLPRNKKAAQFPARLFFAGMTVQPFFAAISFSYLTCNCSLLST